MRGVRDRPVVLRGVVFVGVDQDPGTERLGFLRGVVLAARVDDQDLVCPQNRADALLDVGGFVVGRDQCGDLLALARGWAEAAARVEPARPA